LALAIAVVIKWAPVSAPTWAAGYAELALSDIPLLWMVKRVRDVGWVSRQTASRRSHTSRRRSHSRRRGGETFISPNGIIM